MQHKISESAINLVLCSISYKTLGISESHVGGGSSVALVVGDDLYSVVLPYSYAAVRRSEVDSNGFSSSGGTAVCHLLALCALY